MLTGSLTTRIGDYSYQADRKIGSGYSSEVYRGKNDITGNSVAVKVIEMGKIKGQTFTTLLRNEVQILKSMQKCENVVSVFQIISTKNNTFIVSELCQDGDLSKLIFLKEKLKQKQAIFYLIQLIKGYIQIYSQGIIHRDIKPANILLSNQKIKIADFGFAIRQEDLNKNKSYNVGSPLYMPIESLKSNQYGYTSDIWAIGIVFYEMLTGRAPWKGHTEEQLMKQIRVKRIEEIVEGRFSCLSRNFLMESLKVQENKRMKPIELRSYIKKFERYLQQKEEELESQNAENIDQFELSEIQQNSQVLKATVNAPKSIRTSKFLHRFQSHQIYLQSKEFIVDMTVPKSKGRISINLSKQVRIDKENKDLAIKDIQNQNKCQLNSIHFYSQIHYCRFVYKLLLKIQNNQTFLQPIQVQQLKQTMMGAIYAKLDEVAKIVNQANQDPLKNNKQYEKILRIIKQYRSRYHKQMPQIGQKWQSFDTLNSLIVCTIQSIFKNISQTQISQKNQQLVIIDYLMTFKQLNNLQKQKNYNLFHEKSKIEEIVEGSPLKKLTLQHFNTISDKLKSQKII